MKLYHSPASCSLAVAIALAEADLEAEYVKVDLRSKTAADGSDFLALHPLGYVPVLQLDDGEALAEVIAILQYIADAAPGAGLAPEAGRRDYYRYLAALSFIATELHKTLGGLFAPGLSEEMKAAITRRVRLRLDQHEARWQGRTWVLGEHYSAADGYQFVVLNWLQFVGLELSDWPQLAAHAARVRARPAIQRAMVAVGLG
ncbi:MAG: glutathione S-transferase [Silanimonas sp.]|nr:MAG: glutathione S-transferase [Silanimonas sp.]